MTSPTASLAGSAGSPSDLLAAARAMLPDLLPIRRAIHRRPVLGLDLPETQQRIADELRAGSPRRTTSRPRWPSRRSTR